MTVVRRLLNVFVGRFGWAAIALTLVVLAGACRLVEYWTLRSQATHYAAVADERTRDYLATAREEFTGFQRVTRRIATEVADLPAVREFLLDETVAKRQAAFNAVVRLARDQDAGIEVFNRAGNLMVWEGRSGPSHRREVLIALDGQMTSYVNRTPISAQLFVAIPLRDHGTILGAVLVRRTIDVTYPLNNQFIHREGLTQALGQRLGVRVEFNFSAVGELKRDGRYASEILYGIDSSRVGVVSVQKPPRSAFLAASAVPFLAVNALLLVLLTVVLGTAAWRFVRRAGVSTPRRLIGSVAIIWLARYALLWIDLSALLPGMFLFDAGVFASEFAGGIARTAGDLLLSVAALAATMVVVIPPLARVPDRPAPPLLPLGILLRALLAIVLAMLCFWMLRGFGVFVHRVVFDSSVRFTDPLVLFPSFDLAVMLLCVLGVAGSLLALGTTFVWHILRVWSGGRPPALRHFLWTILTLFLVAPLFDGLADNPVVSLRDRLVFAGLLVGVLFLLERRSATPTALLAPRFFLVLLAGSAVLALPSLEGHARLKDRERIERFAEEVLRPVDGWMTLVVEDGLRRWVAEPSIDALTDGDAEEVERLAFTRWAQSLACREGYASIFEVVDSSGASLSRFQIGSQSTLLASQDSALARVAASRILIRDVSKGVAGMKAYLGVTPIRSYEGQLLGYGRVLVAGGQQTLFRDDDPGVLRSAEAQGLRSFYRPVAVSEFRGGRVTVSNNTAMPIGYRVPDSVQARLSRSPQGTVWWEEQVDDASMETFFVRDPRDSALTVALSLRQPGATWYMVSLVRLATFCVAIGLLVALGVMALRIWRRQTLLATFRDRLFVALLATAVVPLALIAIYGRISAHNRLMNQTSARLSEETFAVTQNLRDQADSLLTAPVARGAALADDLASDLNIDFNLYVGSRMTLTSRPELFEAGILDQRMSGRAYAALFLAGKRFFVETERIGAFEYAVAYRPIVNDADSITAVVSVPTLYRQDTADAELVGRNAFLLGIYLLVLAAVLAIATVVAGRIAAPIHRLTGATSRVARGDLDVQLADDGEPGEIGDLMRSFDAMVADLRRSREQLLRAEREMAWKEMARQVAHEIKNPLTPMRLAVQHLRMVVREGGADLTKVLDEVTTTLLNQIDTLSRIASEFSHFGRLPQPHHAEIDINAVLEEAVALHRQEQGVRFVLHEEPELPRVRADRDELRRAFINILRNAVQAMNGGGTVTITSAISSGEVLIRIADTGPGIPDEVRARLFEPNFSTKTEGMGLGLAIVKKTVSDLGGSIVLTNNAGPGVTVEIRLPGVGRNGGGA